MSNFSPKLEDATDEQLKNGLDIHAPQYAILESDELTRRSLNELQRTIKLMNFAKNPEMQISAGQTQLVEKLNVVRF